MRERYSSCPVCDDKHITFALMCKDYTVSQESFEVWQCDACTARFTQAPPSKEEIGGYYQSDDYISHTDTSKGLINSLYHKVRNITLAGKLKTITKYTGLKSGGILDIGAGTGAFLDTMKKGNWGATGVEPDPLARAKAKELHGLTLAGNEHLFELPFESFDAITMWHVLEHVHDLQLYIQQLGNLLKKNGVIFIAVPNYTSYDAHKYGEYWAAYDVPRHLYHFSPASMKRLLSKNGLKLHKELPMWFDSYYVSMLSEKCKSGHVRLLPALNTGSVSNLKAIMNTERCSSVIYVIKRG